jgi:hypothetical protein
MNIRAAIVVSQTHFFGLKGSSLDLFILFFFLESTFPRLVGEDLWKNDRVSHWFFVNHRFCSLI